MSSGLNIKEFQGDFLGGSLEICSASLFQRKSENTVLKFSIALTQKKFLPDILRVFDNNLCSLYYFYDICTSCSDKDHIGRETQASNL